MDQFQQQRPLPNATPVLVMGILSIVTCFCYGILGLILGIIAIVLAGKDNQLYKASPNEYTLASFKNMNAGKICAIIGIILSLLYLIMTIAVIAIIGTDALGNPDEMRRIIEEKLK